MKRKRNCYPQKQASQPARPNSYSILGSTLETINSKVVATLDVLPNLFCARIGEDKKVVKFVTQESKFTHTHTHTHLHFPWVGKLFIILRLNPQPTCKSKVTHWVGLTPNPMTSLYYYYYYMQRRHQALLNPKKTLVHSVFKPSVGVGPHIIIIM
jgi:hypothetical protein